MAFKFEIIDNVLVVTDTSDSSVAFDKPAGDTYYRTKELDDGIVSLFDTSGVNDASSVIFSKPLSECIDSSNTPFTATSFRAFARPSLGKDSPQGSGKDFFGFLDYNDASTAITPINVVGGGGFVFLTNDAAGGFTNKNFPPPGVTDIWDSVNNRFFFSQLSLGSKFDYRLDIEVTTTSPNQEISVEIELAIGGVSYSLEVAERQYKTAKTHKLNVENFVYMGDLNTKDNFAKFKIASDGNATVKVNGWACYVFVY